MASDQKDGADAPRQPRSSDAEIERYRADRQRPKKLARPVWMAPALQVAN